jgi:hypothetical protein
MVAGHKVDIQTLNYTAPKLNTWLHISSMDISFL